MATEADRRETQLRRSDIILLTGAGASVPLGLPDTRQLMDHLVGLRSDLEGFLKRIIQSHEGGVPDIEWILERLDLYEDIDRELQADQNLSREAERTVKDVVKRCADAAERVRSAFPKYEAVEEDASLGAPTTLRVSGLAELSPDSGLVATPVPQDLISGVPLEQEPSTVAWVPSTSSPTLRRRQVKPPAFEPDVDEKQLAMAMFGTVTDQARRLRDAVYDNIIRIYNKVDPELVGALYGPLILPLWEYCQGVSSRLTVFTTNWDPTFYALKDVTDLPIIAGMTQGAYDSHWDPAVYRQEGLHVHHLHGCCRWVMGGEIGGQIVYNPLPLQGTTQSEYEVPVLYRPRTKAGLVLQEPHATAYAFLDRAATTPAVWIVVGYSFRDEPIQRVLERAAVRGTISKLIVLDPVKEPAVPEELQAAMAHSRYEFGDPDGTRSVLAAFFDAVKDEGDAASDGS